MKKSFIYALGLLFASSAFVACNNEEALQGTDDFSVKAGIGVQTRTELGEDYSTVTWNQEDKIYLFGNGAKATMRLINGAGTTVGTFTGIIEGFAYNLTHSLYPVPTINGDEYSYELPAEREYDKNNGAPLLGDFSNNYISFENLTSMIRVPLTASATDRVLVLEMEGIAGKLVVDVENCTATITGGTNKVTVTVPAGEACFIDIPVPAKTYANGYKVSVDGNVIAETTDAVEMTTEGVKVILNEPAVDENTGEYQIATSADLLWFAKEVNSGTDFKNVTLVMTQDIDMSGIPWTPIGKSGKLFYGIFDGQDHTISNLKVAATDNSPVGLFASNRGLIKNVKMQNVDIKGYYKAGAIVGDGLCSRVESCSVDGGSITIEPLNKDDGNQAGGIVGYLSAEPTAYVKDCSVSNLTIKAYRDLGGIAGTANGGTPEVSGNTVSNTTLIIDQTAEYKEVKAPNVAEIVGRNIKAIDLASNTANNVTIEVTLSSVEELKTAAKVDGASLKLAAGEYGKFPEVSGKNVTIECEEGTVFKGSSQLNINGATVIGATFSNPSGSAVGQTINGTFKNCTFTGSNALRYCYAGATCVFEDCVFSGDLYGVHFDGGKNPATFTRCTFSGFNAFGSAITLLTLKGCTFVGNGKSGYNGANLWGSTILDGCEFIFDGSTSNEWIDCITAAEFKNCIINGYDYKSTNYESFLSYIWSRNDITVKIDGVDCALK